MNNQDVIAHEFKRACKKVVGREPNHNDMASIAIGILAGLHMAGHRSGSDDIDGITAKCFEMVQRSVAASRGAT